MPGILGSRRGSTLAAALALTFLVFAVTTASLTRVAASYTQVSTRHGQTTALFLAEAGVHKAAAKLLSDPAYTGERGNKLPTGRFDVTVAPGDGGFVVTSIGYADSPFKNRPKRTVRAIVRLNGAQSFRITDWRENP